MRHLDVGDQHVRPQALNERPGLGAVGGATDDFEVRLQRKQGRQRATHHALVLGDDDADHAFTAGSGTCARTTVPCPPRISSVPPTAAMRWRMPFTPWPSMPG